MPFLSADAAGPKHLLCDVSRSDFEQLISHHLDDIDHAVAAFATDTKVKVSCLLMVGGGCRVPAVRRRLAAVGTSLGIPHIVEPPQPEEINAVGVVARAKSAL